MLYPSKIRRISIDPKQPILSRKSDGLIWAGQRKGLSIGDIEMINILYQPLKVFTDYPEKNDVTPFGVKVGGNVATDNGSPIIARGACWSTNRHPTKDNNKTVDGTGLGQFYSQISGLVPNTTYWVRAYATNANETAYGNEYRFDTPVYENAPNTFVDSRDQNLYKSVLIGTQVWMVQNLAYLPVVSPPDVNSLKDPCYYVYDYSGTDVEAAKLTSNYRTYGVLYNWAAALASSPSSNTVPSGVKGVCPDGWHLPSDAEWDILEKYLMDNHFYFGFRNQDIAKSMAANDNWKTYPIEGNPGNDMASNNKSGFSALPAGIKSYSKFLALGEEGYWWTSDGHFSHDGYPSLGISANLSYNEPFLSSSTEDGRQGFSIRCLKD
ncbi:MAG TPA: FISUMP domain-containing protein [Bacteroidales bacterium]|nr:FISUMP domain-containing protein [Bacteroidales bacterium]